MRSAEITSKISMTLNSFIEVIKTNNINSIYVLFSGGRDSLVALHLSKTVSDMLKLEIKALHVDTTISTPGNLEYVKEVCKELEVDLVIQRPKYDFFTLVNKWGFPTTTRRWCCYHLKIEPLKEFFKNVDTSKILLTDGIRADESWRRREFPKFGWHRHFKCLNYHPIFEWSKEDVREYIRIKNLKENPLYEKLPRVSECWCTAFKTIKQFKILKHEWPELFSKFVEAEASLKTGGSALFKNGKRIYLKDL
jgi:3'-phosphoadenosine 5'-phosphosulfate sulfotransferase (PAPS reductase)/FAD synthetase